MKYYLNVAMDIRAYGKITVETDDPEKIKEIVTAKYVRDNFEPHGSGDDDFGFEYPSDICITDMSNDDGDDIDVPEELECIPNGDWIRE